MATPPLDRPPPSTLAVAFATAILAGLTGFFIGQASSIGLFSKPSAPNEKASVESDLEPSESESEGAEEDDEEGAQQELASFDNIDEECKLVLVVRTDLGMTKGKIAAQCGHATLACYKALASHTPASTILRRWERYGQAKVALQVKSEDDLLVLQAQAVSLGICAHVVHDAGRTQIASGSATVLGVGPAPKSVVDQVTGHLKLL